MSNIVDAFLQSAAEAGDKPFLVEHGAPVLPFAGLDADTGQLAARLHALGGAPGDRVLVQVEKSPEAVVLYLATLRAGMIFVPLNTAYKASELAYFIEDADPAIIVCRPADERDVLDLVCHRSNCRVVTLDTDGTGSLCSGLGRDRLSTVDRADGDVACILYTSGTTGVSKGAMLTHSNLLSNARTLAELWCWSADDVLIHILPIYHVHGLFVALHCALIAGATVLFHREFVAPEVIGEFDRATVLMGVPTHYSRLLAQDGLTAEVCRHMRVFISGSAPLLTDVHERFTAKSGHDILERYGMTETGMIASNPYDGSRMAGTVGFALPGIDVRVTDAEGFLVPTGEPGVLEVRGPNVFRGYWRKPEKTADDFRPDGFFVTGDIATMDEDGRITLVGRAKDLIIAGGLNIYPKEIEEKIDALPGVVESAVIGVPHPDLGEAVVAVVVAREDVGASIEATIPKALAVDLARFKQPRRVIVVDTLPRNAMGKVQKAVLREKYSGLFDERAIARNALRNE